MNLTIPPMKATKTKDGQYMATVDWCAVLSTRSHRSCGGCGCECHRTFHNTNYEGTTEKARMRRARKVKRVG